MPVMLRYTIEYLEDGSRRVLLLAGVAAAAAASVHGLIFAIAALGAVICCAVALLRLTRAEALRRSMAVGALLAVAAAYPAWQALALGDWLAAEGISFATA